MNHVWSAGRPAVVSGNTQCQILFDLVVHDEIIGITLGRGGISSLQFSVTSLHLVNQTVHSLPRASFSQTYSLKNSLKNINFEGFDDH